MIYFILRFQMASIVKLPEDLASLPAATVDVFLCNLLPIDEDNTWGLIFRQLIDAKIQECAKEPKSKFIGKVRDNVDSFCRKNVRGSEN